MRIPMTKIVEISFWHNTIVTHSNPTKLIPFIDNKSWEALEKTTDFKGPMLGPIQVRAETRRVPTLNEVQHKNLHLERST